MRKLTAHISHMGIVLEQKEYYSSMIMNDFARLAWNIIIHGEEGRRGRERQRQ